MKFFQLYIRKQVLARDYKVSDEVLALFMILSYMCKVRGFKTVLRFFPHEVADMEVVTEMI